MRASTLPRIVWRGLDTASMDEERRHDRRICFVGLDVHARKTAAAAVQLGSGEVFKAQIPGPPVEAIELAADAAGPGPRGL